MSDERPIQLKVQKKLVISSGKVCTVHDSSVCGESAKLGNLIRNAVAIRQSLPSEGAIAVRHRKGPPSQTLTLRVITRKCTGVELPDKYGFTATYVLF